MAKEKKEIARTFISPVGRGNEDSINKCIAEGYTVKSLVDTIFTDRGEIYIHTTVVFNKPEEWF